MESKEIIRVRPGFDAADLEQDPNLLFVIIREAGGPEMVTYERINRQVEFMIFIKRKMIRVGHSKWNIWTEELL